MGEEREQREFRRPMRGSRQAQAKAGNGKIWIIVSAVCGGVGLLVLGIVLLVNALSNKDPGYARGAEYPTTPLPVFPPGFEPGAGPGRPPELEDPGAPVPMPPARPPETPPAPPPNALPPIQPPADPPKPLPAGGGDGRLPPEVLKQVKNATVLVRVTMGDGRGASGTGFFGVDSNIILTNAHVVGMLNPGSPMPQSVELVLNSGEADEKTLPGHVLGVDRVSDLAVLRAVQTGAEALKLPKPLAVRSAADLLETQQVYVFGFPLGERLGKNITVSSSSVSSLRKDSGGALSQVQVNGGMHPGNSGGPVVDAAGNVVGVAVAGIPGTQINFAIPGDNVQAVLDGRIAAVAYGDTVRRGKETVMPVTVQLIDPLERVKKVALDTWVGDAKLPTPAPGAAAELPPGVTRKTVTLDYKAGSAKGDLLLPDAPQGKVHWIQPMVMTGGGKSIWLAPKSHEPEPAVDARPILLTVKHRPGERIIHLNSKAVYKLHGYDGEEHSFLAHIDSRLLERTHTITPQGSARIRLSVSKLELGVSIDDQGPPKSQRMEQLFQNLDALFIDLEMDPYGNVARKSNDLSQMPAGAQPLLGRLGEQMQDSLDTVAVPIPRGQIKPGQTWKATRQFPIETPDDFQRAALDMTYTYKGIQTRNGKNEAVIGFTGTLRGARREDVNVSGRARGNAFIDLTTGLVVQSRAHVDLEMNVRFLDESFKAGGQLHVYVDRSESAGQP